MDPASSSFDASRRSISGSGSLESAALPGARPNGVAKPAARAGMAGASRPYGATHPKAGMIGLLLFLGSETMFFAALISAAAVLRARSSAWPPPDQPRLPIGITVVNTLLLLVSGVTMSFAVRAARRPDGRSTVRWLAITTVLGTAFLSIQGSEWVRLLALGLTPSASTYGAAFYALIGAHAAHALLAVIVLAFVLVRASAGRYTSGRTAGLELCRAYWMFVVGLWVVLFFTVYL